MREITHKLAFAHDRTVTRYSDVFDPNNGGVQARVALGDAALLDGAVEAAKKAQPAWAAVNPQRRARVMFNFKTLVERHMDELAHMLSSEHGKVIADAKGDIQRGLEAIEFCCGIPHVLKGEFTQGAGPGIDVYSMRQPLGIGTNQHGMKGVKFWTKVKTVTERWPDGGASGDSAFVIPTMG